MDAALTPHYPSLEEAFINSAYLSELWAVQDLVRFKRKFPNSWGPQREKQLQDEVVHARILLDALKEKTPLVVMDVEYSMQERLYRKYIDLSRSQSPEDYAAIHQMTEARAVWIYKTFMRLNPQSIYNPILKRILKDEESHFDIDLAANYDSSLSRLALQSVDRLLFRGYLPQRYGSIIFKNPQFWSWYYEGAKLSDSQANPMDQAI